MTAPPPTPRRCIALWLLMLLVAIANGVLRDFTYGPYMSELAAHQVSTLTAMLLLGLLMRGFVRRHPPASARQALSIGLAWSALTVAFEFLFFHFVGGRPWSELAAAYDLGEGRLWPLLLAWIAIAPYVLFRRTTGEAHGL